MLNSSTINETSSFLFTHLCAFQITVSQDERRDDERMYHKMSLADLQKMSPFVSFQVVLIIFNLPIDRVLLLLSVFLYHVEECEIENVHNMTNNFVAFWIIFCFRLFQNDM